VTKYVEKQVEAAMVGLAYSHARNARYAVTQICTHRWKSALITCEIFAVGLIKPAERHWPLAACLRSAGGERLAWEAIRLVSMSRCSGRGVRAVDYVTQLPKFYHRSAAK